MSSGGTLAVLRTSDATYVSGIVDNDLRCRRRRVRWMIDAESDAASRIPRRVIGAMKTAAIRQPRFSSMLGHSGSRLAERGVKSPLVSELLSL
jgi:hypothetical protein